MRSIGLDLSTTGTGLVIVEKLKGAKKIATLTDLVISPKDMERYDRVLYIQQTVMGFVEEFDPDIAVIEGYGQGLHRNVASFVKLVEVGTVIRMGLRSVGKLWVEVPPSSLKKFVTGNGRAKGKEVMIDGVRTRWGYVTSNHNLADAYGLAVFGLAHQSVIPVEPWQVDAMDGVKHGQ